MPSTKNEVAVILSSVSDEKDAPIDITLQNGTKTQQSVIENRLF